MSGESKHNIHNWLADQEAAMTDLLGRLVNIDSGSYNQEGVNRVGEVISQHLQSAGLNIRRIPTAVSADCIQAYETPQAPARDHLLLLGHRDTVFPDGTAAQRPFRIENGKAFGPGVADMKAGLVMNTFVLEAFKKFGGNRHPLTALYTVDEEIGSPDSRTIIEATAHGARGVFNAEPGRPPWKIVTARKGATFLKIRITGKPAHSGARPEDGISAIEELSRKIQALHALTDFGQGTTVNVGLIRGGEAVNMVAPWAEAEIDFRFKTMEQRDQVWPRLNEILTTPLLAGTQTGILQERGFLPLSPAPAHAELLQRYRSAAAEQGIEVEDMATGGSADSGFTAQIGVPTICALGPIGEEAHTPHEYMQIETMVPRAQVLATTLLSL